MKDSTKKIRAAMAAMTADAKLEIDRARKALCAQAKTGRSVCDQQLRLEKAKQSLASILSGIEYAALIAKKDENQKKLRLERQKNRKNKIDADSKLRAAYLKKARQRALANRKTDSYARWRKAPETRERIRKLKEKYRREAGAVPREVVSQQAAARRAKMNEIRQQRKRDRQDFLAAFVGPPSAGSRAVSKAQYYQWKMLNQADFYAKELDRAQSYKAKTRTGYRDSIVGWANMPKAVKEAKHAIYLIARQLKENEDENDQ